MKTQKGFTLIEILASMAILGVLVFLTFLLLDKKDIALNKLATRQLALQIAQSEMESIRSTGQLKSRSQLSGKNQQMLTHLKAGMGQVVIEPFSQGVKKVQVVVKWQNDRGASQTIQLTTLVKQ